MHDYSLGFLIPHYRATRKNINKAMKKTQSKGSDWHNRTLHTQKNQNISFFSSTYEPFTKIDHIWKQNNIKELK